MFAKCTFFRGLVLISAMVLRHLNLCQPLRSPSTPHHSNAPLAAHAIRHGAHYGSKDHLSEVEDLRTPVNSLENGKGPESSPSFVLSKWELLGKSNELMNGKVLSQSCFLNWRLQ
jgi:hypothetical protein